METIMKKRVVLALGHRALGTTLPEQKVAVKHTAKCIADLIEEGYKVAITHSNAPQVGMIHTAMNEFAKNHTEYTPAPMSVCSAMSQGYIGYDLQNGIREELLNRGIYRTVSTVLTQVVVDPYDEAFYTPTKVLGRYMNAEEANEERRKGNYVIEEAGKGFRRVVSAPNPVRIVELDAVNALLEADQIVIAAGGGGIPVLEQDNHLKGASAVIEKDLAAGKLAEGIDADEVMLAALDAGAEDVITEDEEEIEIVTAPEDLESVKNAIEAAGYETKEAEITMLPETTIEITDEQQAKQVLTLLGKLEDYDDIQNVYSNADIPEEIMEKIAD